MQTVEMELTARQAIDAGFQLFRDLVESTTSVDVERVLLEGVEYSDGDHEWLITIGFDAGETKRRKRGYGGGLGAALGNNEETTEAVREIRKLWLNAKDGSLVRMT